MVEEQAKHLTFISKILLKSLLASQSQLSSLFEHLQPNITKEESTLFVSSVHWGSQQEKDLQLKKWGIGSSEKFRDSGLFGYVLSQDRLKCAETVVQKWRECIAENAGSLA